MAAPHATPVKSFEEAQARIPFPAVEPPGEESPETWATVRSVHRFEECRIRVKQFVADFWWDMSCVKNLVSHRADGNIEGYGPITAFDVGPQVGLHGTDYEGAEAGSLVNLMVQIEPRALDRAIGPGLMKRFLSGTKAATPEAAAAISTRPFPSWSWTMRAGGRPPWPKGPEAPRPVGRLRWFTHLREGERAWGERLAPLDIPGYRFEGVGILRNPEHRHAECSFFMRSTDGHRGLEVRYVGWGSRLREAYTKPLGGPLYELTRTQEDGRDWQVCVSPTLRSRRLLTDLAQGQLGVILPPESAFDRRRDLRIAESFAEALASRI